MSGILAVVKLYVNGKLLDKLSEIAVFSYRIRVEKLNN